MANDSDGAPYAPSDLADGNTNIDFHHPYTPYDVQRDFMQTAYGVLEKGGGQIGILESPTGTGKSLSIICAAMTWVRNHKKATFETSVVEVSEELRNEPDWIVDQMLRRKREEVVKHWQEKESTLERIRAKEKLLEERGSKRRKIGISAAEEATEEDEDEGEWLLADRDDQDEPGNATSSFSVETRSLMEKLGIGGLNPKNDEDEPPIENEIKIYYTSRTHSQLTQFISELRRPSFPATIPDQMLPQQSECPDEGIKHVPLSSRQRLCINQGVAKLGSLQAINDKCAELQQPKSVHKCQFMPGQENLPQTHQFRDTALATLPDIEDLYGLGKKLSVCPYYASRAAIPGAEIITLPYPLLLQKTARDALGIDLEGNVVIIDEAHNIMDAVANVYAAAITVTQLKRCRQMLAVYVKKFGKKLKGENRVMVAQVARVVDGLSAWLEGVAGIKSDQGIVDANELLKSKGIDQINLYQLIQYIQDSKLAYKIEGYASHVEQGNDDNKNARISYTSTPVLHTFLSFLISLTNLSSEGRIFYHKLPAASKDEPPDIRLSYLLLSPTHAFSSIASAARAVILAGGTMSPFEDYTAHLFPDLPSSKITTLSCGHVIPASSLCVWTLANPKPGIDFEFSYQKRGDRTLITELGLSILNICGVVPDGVVVFFPSYGYLEEVVTSWKASHPTQKSMWDRLEAKKAVLQETKGGSSDEILATYSESILGKPGSNSQSATNTRGALLLSVVGGKMSEGINFSDRLGRCVIVVGLPYPNINSPDWKARIEYIESTTAARLKSSDTAAKEQEVKQQAKQAARDFYENACMRAVNQSIGRAIRHKGDYAAIVLVDRRFASPRIKSKLPGWIQGGIVEASEKASLGQLMGRLGKFFREKKNQA